MHSNLRTLQKTLKPVASHPKPFNCNEKAKMRGKDTCKTKSGQACPGQSPSEFQDPSDQSRPFFQAINLSSKLLGKNVPPRQVIQVKSV